ncbi:MAG: HAMP domain-containing protein [Dehalococcoidales bacterium]|nr:HAMP domain-containing protein [Dehalococcoidales bacterium]
MMRKMMHSLQIKLVLSFVALIIVITGGTFLLTLGQTRTALLEATRENLTQIIGMVSTQITPADINVMSGFKAGDETSDSYLSMLKKLRNMRALSPNITNLYVMRLVDEKITFVVDDVEDDPAAIGQVYEEPEAKLFDAVNGPAVSNNLYTDEWGTFLSGYAPLKDTAGNTALIIGADMEAAKVAERLDFIGNTIYIIMGLAILLAAVIIGIFSVTIIRDIKKLNKTADEISKGNTNVSVNVNRKDEIGELAESFGRMVTSLKIMMAEDEK